MLKKVTIITAMLTLFTLLVAPWVLAQQEENGSNQEPSTDSHYYAAFVSCPFPPPNPADACTLTENGITYPDGLTVPFSALGSPSPDTDVGFLQYAPSIDTQQAYCGYPVACDIPLYTGALSVPTEDDQSAP